MSYYNQQSLMSYEEDIDWEDWNLDADAGPPLEAARELQTPVSSILHGPMGGFDPDIFQVHGYGTPVGDQLGGQSFLWSDSSSPASSYNAQLYSNSAAGADHVMEVPCRTLIVNGFNDAIEVQPMVSPAPSYGDGPLLQWRPSSSSFGPAYWPSSNYNEVVQATAAVGSFIPTTAPNHYESAQVAAVVTPSSSGKLKAPRSRARSKKAAGTKTINGLTGGVDPKPTFAVASSFSGKRKAPKATSSKSRRLNDIEVLFPVQEQRNEDADDEADLPKVPRSRARSKKVAGTKVLNGLTGGVVPEPTVVVASSSSGKRKARPSSKKVAATATTAATSRPKRTYKKGTPVPAPMPRKEVVVRRRQYLYELNPDDEPNLEKKAQIVKARSCKDYRDQVKSKNICPHCLAMCRGDLKLFERVRKMVEKLNQDGQQGC